MRRVEYICPSCDARVPAPLSLAGQSAPCPRCHAHVECWPDHASASEPELATASLPPARTPRWAWAVTAVCVTLFCVLLLASRPWATASPAHLAPLIGGALAVPAPTGLRSDRELRARAFGERVTVTGRIGIGGHGTTEFTDLAPNREKSPDTTPTFDVTLSDGTRVTCAFDATPRGIYEEWLKRNPPGTVHTIEGRNMGYSYGGYLLVNCRVLPNRFGR